MSNKASSTFARISRATIGLMIIAAVFSIAFGNKAEKPGSTTQVAADVTANHKSGPASEEVFLRETYGCRDWETWQRLGKIVAQGDKEAFARLLGGALASGTCRRFKAGDPAYLSDTAIFSGSSCMRPKGETTCYWVSIETTGRP